MTAPRISDADLEWLAFRYAAGELQAAELDQFEQLLATDERACMAVAQAVMLGQAVMQIEQLSDKPRHNERGQVEYGQVEHSVTIALPAKARSTRRSAIAAACCAAGVALAAGWPSFTTPASKQSVETASTVAALWVHGADDEQASETILPASPEPVDLEDEDAVPGWLLAAVTEQQNAEDGEEMMQD